MKRSSLRIPLLVAMAFIAVAFWWRARAALETRQFELDRIRLEAGFLKSRREFTARHLESLRDDLRRERRQTASLLAGAMAGESRLARENPDLRWSEPPTELPAWNKESPYVWIRKSVLNSLPIPGLNLKGQLPSVLCQVLDLTPDQKNAVEAAASKLLADYGNAELAAARSTENHLNGVAGLPGSKVTVEIPPLPDVASQLQSEFDQSLQAQLGAPRANLVEAWSAGILTRQLNLDTGQPTIISVRRAPDGWTYITTQRGGALSGTAGSDISLDNEISQPLLPLFQAVAGPPSDLGSLTAPP